MLDRAAPLVKPGGRIAYVTCSVLAEENGRPGRGLPARHPDLPSCRRRVAGRRWARPRLAFPQAVLMLGAGPADDAAADRHRWIFCEHPARRQRRDSLSY